MAEEVKKVLVYSIQIALVCAITLATQNMNAENLHIWMTIIARYVFYILLIKGCRVASIISYKKILYNTDLMQTLGRCLKEDRKYILIFTVASSILGYSKLDFFDEHFIWFFIAFLISQYPDVEKPTMINYGVGMACSYFEGYLTQVIPSDGATFVGFQENIAIFESNQHVVFPVKRLFIIITKSLYCPPNLKQFNKINRPDLPYLEACTSLEDVVRDVAGVTNRTYRNSAYKIHRPSGPLVYLAAECATPLHTLHKVLMKRSLYEKLCDVDAEEIVKDFCEQLETTIARSPDCRNKCTLVHYDDSDPNVNLADVLLDKIREIEPDFDNIIIQHHNIEEKYSTTELRTSSFF